MCVCGECCIFSGSAITKGKEAGVTTDIYEKTYFPSCKQDLSFTFFLPFNKSKRAFTCRGLKIVTNYRMDKKGLTAISI